MEVYEQQIRDSRSNRNERGEELQSLRASIEKVIDSETAMRLITLIDDYAADLDTHEKQNAKLREIVLEYEEIIKENQENESNYEHGDPDVLSRLNEYETLADNYACEIDELKRSKTQLEN